MKGLRLVILATAFLACLLITGCESRFDVSGGVVSQTTGSAVASATVTCGDQTVVTDANGTFTLVALEQGPQTIKAVLEGYPPAVLSIDVREGGEPVKMSLPDSRLSGTIREVAIEPEIVTTATVTVAGLPVTVTETATFSVAGLRPGETTVTVESPNRIARETLVRLAPGDNSVEVTLTVDVKETYRRYNAAATYDREDVAYRYLHPDVRKYRSLEQFKTDDDFTFISLTLGDTRIVKDFQSKYTGKTYSSVTQVDRQLVGEDEYGQFTNNFSQHWELMPDGMWYLIWNFDRE